MGVFSTIIYRCALWSRARSEMQEMRTGLFVDCASTTPCDNFEDDALVNQWFTSNIGKVRKPFKCYDKSFCLSEETFSYNVLHCLFFRNKCNRISNHSPWIDVLFSTWKFVSSSQ